MNRSNTPKSARKTAAYVAALLTLGSVCAYGQSATPEPSTGTPSEAELQKQKQLEQQVRKSTAEAKSTTSEEEIVQLSPFVVESEKDEGYLAKNTMGSRLNTKLDDVASSISVVTKQQLSDFALIDINDIFALEANTEGTSNYTANSNTGNATQETDDVALNRQGANRVRGLGAANIAVGNFAATANVPIDTYNVDAVEISRGPNSNVFGTGDASGVVNLVPASANLSRPFTKTTVMGTSRGTIRGTIDVNRPLFKDLMGVRVLASATNEKFTRKPSYDKTRRTTTSFTFRPHRNTTLRVGYENFEETYSRPNSYTPRERMTTWNAAGRPSWDPTTNTFTYYNADGTVSKTGTVSKATQKISGVTINPWDYRYWMTGNSSADTVYLGSLGSSRVRPTMALVNGEISSFAPTSIGVGPQATAVGGTSSANLNLNWAELAAVSYSPYFGVPSEYRTPTAIGFNPFTGTNDKSFYDWTKVNLSGANSGRKTARFLRAELEQYFLQTEHHLIAAQFGAFKEDILDWTRSYVGSGRDGVPYDIQPDVNRFLLDGSVNPNYGKPYITALVPKAKAAPYDTLTKKVNMVYQLDLTREKNWFLRNLGRQRILGYYEHKRAETPTQPLFYNDQITTTFDGKWFSSNAAQPNQTNTTVYGPSGSIEPWLQGGYWPAGGTRQANTTYGIRANAQAVWNTRYYVGDTSGNVDFGSLGYNTTSTTIRRYGNNTGYTKGTNGLYLPGTPAFNAKNPYVYANTPDPYSWSTENVELGTELIGLGGLMQKSIYQTKGGVYQGWFWGDRIIPVVGVRQDTLRVKDWSGFSAITEIDPLTGFYTGSSQAFVYDTNPYKVFNTTTGNTYARGTTRTLGLVVKPFKWINLSYNQSNSMRPEEYMIDFQGNPLPNPYGETKDYGVRLFFFDEKLSLRLTRYETVNTAARQSANSVYARALQMDFDTGTTDTSKHDLVDWYFNELAASRGIDTSNLSVTDPNYLQLYADTFKAINFSPEYIDAIQQAQIRMTTDEESKGYEAEIFYTPNRWFSLKLTGSMTEAKTTGISKSFQDYKESRWNTWTTIESPNKVNHEATRTAAIATAQNDDELTAAQKDTAIAKAESDYQANMFYWKHVFSDGSGSDVRTYWYSAIENQVKLNYALQGKSKPQVRKFKFNVMPTLRLSGLTKNKILRNINLGGSMRWEDKGAIGFYGEAPTLVPGTKDTNLYIQGYDANNPIYDKSHAYFDFWASYGFRLFKDRIKGSVQLNVVNAFEPGGLRPFSANPDGSIYGYRIIDPREFKLTVSFDL